MAEESGFSRRAFIGTVAAAAGASALAPAAGLAQRAGATTGKGLIDFHHHFDPPPAVTGRLPFERLVRAIGRGHLKVVGV